MIYIPNINFNFYGLCLIISFLAYLIILVIVSVKEKFNDYEIASIVALESISWMIAMFFFRSSFYALILIAVAGLVFFLITKTEPKRLFAMLVFSVPLIYAIGKVGCFLNGCCYGMNYSGPLSVIYEKAEKAPIGTNLFPVQLSETVANLIIFITAIIIYHKKKDIRYTLPFNLIACSTAKFALDFVRANRTHLISLNQIFCIIALILGIVLFIKIKKQKTKTNKENI